LYCGIWFTDICSVSNGSSQGCSFEVPGTGTSYSDIGDVSSGTGVYCANRTSESDFVFGESSYFFIIMCF